MDWAIGILVVATLNWALLEALALIGFFGALSRERLERCPDCGRMGLTTHGTMHPNGCPAHHLVFHLRTHH